jgi:hypothetical protein
MTCNSFFVDLKAEALLSLKIAQIDATVGLSLLFLVVIRSISMPATQSSHEFLFQARRVLQLCLEGLANRL